MIGRLAIVGMFAAIIVLALLYSRAPANAGDYPPVGELQRQIGVYYGAALPKQVVWHGRVFQPIYLGATKHGRRYIVTLELN
jgi:hypothetical protein